LPVSTPHPAYSANVEAWTRCRDAYAGEDAVKAQGDLYLPKIDPSQDGPGYASYVKRALYYEAVGRTVDGFVGAISRKPHTLTLPAQLDVFTDDATGDGIGLNEFIRRMCAENLLRARGGVLVDYDEAQQRTYFSLYTAEAIINWWPGGVVLQETVYEPMPEDPFVMKAVDQFRVLTLIGAVYTVTIWRKKAGQMENDGWAVHQTINPTRRGKPLEELPFFWLSVLGRTERIEKPPLLGLVNVSLSHYRTSADLEHGRHFAGLPTLWVSGVAGDEPIRIGAATAIVLSDPSARAGYAEFTGQGLGSLETALDSKEHMMAVLGAAVFGGGKKGVEAAETARIRTAGENSLLMSVVAAVEETLRAALECAANWMGASDTVEIVLNRDFMDQSIDPQMMVGLVAALQANAISLETFLYNLQQAEMLQPEAVIEDEAALLRAQAEKAAADAIKLAQATKPPPVKTAA
jgi:hypothetical protein